MKNKTKKNNILLWPIKLLFSRFTLAVISILLQCLIIFGGFYFFNRYVIYFIGGMGVLAIILVIYMCSKNNNNDFTTSWIILVLAIPTVGPLFYLFCKIDLGVNTLRRRLIRRKEINRKYLPQNKSSLLKLKDLNIAAYYHANYLYQAGHFPIYKGVGVEYFKIGEEWYQDLLRKLEMAEKFIFLEFFIIANDEMWNGVLDILKRKAQSGVEVRILYDGTCSFVLLKKTYPEELKEYGIKCKVFSPIVPIISTHYNNRDHRKIVVIDGNFAYTGGANMANEYINNPSRFKHWKDTMIRFSGNAVNSLTVLFLENWNLDLPQDSEHYEKYIKEAKNVVSSGFLIPFGDDPFDDEAIGKQSYLYLLQNAKETVDIIMPYFIVDASFFECMLHTAKKGIKIRLIMPGIADKKFVNYVAKTYYKDLIVNGIEIYEYPGFTHAKMMIKDTDEAIIGTINLDYRGLYLHFEDGVYLFQNKEIINMKEDYEETILKCQKITDKELKEYSKLKLLIGKVLRLFAPLL